MNDNDKLTLIIAGVTVMFITLMITIKLFVIGSLIMTVANPVFMDCKSDTFLVDRILCSDD
jgi:hypothetical protein